MYFFWINLRLLNAQRLRFLCATKDVWSFCSGAWVTVVCLVCHKIEPTVNTWHYSGFAEIILQVMLSTLVSIALHQCVRMLLKRYSNATFSVLMFLAVEMLYGSGISRVFVGERLSSQIHWDSIVGLRVWRSWLRHWARIREVAGSIPDGGTGIFRLHNPSGRTVALGSTHPLTEVSTNGIFWG